MKKLYTHLLFMVLLVCSNRLNAQIIKTIAGNGINMYTGDGGLATLARITPSPVRAVDKFGNIYIVSGNVSNRIRVISPAGIIATFAGTSTWGFSGDGGPASAAQLHYPYDAAVDTAGNVYIADHLNYRIRKVSATTHIINTIAGNGIAATTGDGGAATAASVIPYALCVDNAGNIYFIDGYGTKVRKIDTAGIISTVAGTGTGGFSGDGGPATAANLAMNYGICLDSSNNLYLACDTRIRKIDIATGIINTIAGTGSTTYTGDGILATAASFVAMTLCIDASTSELYIQDIGHERVFKIDAAGMFYTVAGTGVAGYSGDGGPATSAQLYNPEGAAVDACGNLYIGDVANYRIRKITFNPSPIATISIAVAPNDTVCAGTPVTYTATTTGASTAGYQWYKNGVAVPGATNATYTYAATVAEGGDSVRCVYTGVDLCSFSGHPVSNTLHVVATPLTVPVISLSSVPAGAATAGSVVTVNATVALAGSSYSIDWYRNSVLFATTTVPYALYTKAAGTDVITARIRSTDETGCYDTTTAVAINIAQAMVGVAPVVPVLDASLYPNPAHHLLEVAATATIAQLTITNAAGRVYAAPQTATGSNCRIIDVSGLPAGLYLLQVTDVEGRRAMSRFVKE